MGDKVITIPVRDDVPREREKTELISRGVGCSKDIDLKNSLLPSLRWNVFSNLLANLMKGICQLGLIIALAKLGSKEMVGQYALGVAVAWPVFLLADLELRIVQATDARGDFHFGHYLGLRLLTTPLAFLAVMGFAWVLGYRLETVLVVGGVALSRGLFSVADCIHGGMQQKERLDLVSLSTIMRTLGSFGLFIIVFYASGNLLWALLSQALISTLVLLIFDCPKGVQVLGLKTGIWIPRFERIILWRLARLALPLGLVVMLISVNANFPRYLLEYSLGEGAVGIFAALSQPALAGTTVMSALGHAIMPRMARGYAGGNFNYLIRMVWRLIGLGTLLGGVMLVGTLCWGRQIISLIYRPEYAEQHTTLVWLMAGGTFNYISIGLAYGLNATRAYSRYLAYYTVSAAVGAVLGILVIPAFGLVGAAWTVCGTKLLSCLFMGWLFLVLRRKGEGYAARI